MATLIICVNATAETVSLFCGEGNDIILNSKLPTKFAECGNSEVRIVSVDKFEVGGKATFERRPKGGGSVTSGVSEFQRDNEGFCLSTV